MDKIKDMIEELEKTAQDFEDTRYGLLITASEMMTKLYQENERLRDIAFKLYKKLFAGETIHSDDMKRNWTNYIKSKLEEK